MTLQEFIHSIEAGGLAKWVRGLVVLAVIAAAYTFFVFYRFHGLSDAKGMEQAQIAREIARGNGFSTKVFQPLGIELFKEFSSGKKMPTDKTPDIYHAPLNPLVNSFFLRLTKGTWLMTKNDVAYPSDRMIATVSALFFVLAFIVNFFIALRVFDAKIAQLAIGLALICDQYWKFSTSGLPQMLMFFIFSCCLYLLLRAIEAQRDEKTPAGWLAGAGFLFGLLALTHGLTIWIFIGAFVFSAFHFRSRPRDVAIMLVIFCAVYSPWLIRNYKVCGNPFGLGIYSVIGSIDGSEISRLRSTDVTLNGLSLGALKTRMIVQTIFQSGMVLRLLGQNLIAPVFFLTLLYLFKKREAAIFRWCILWMWVFAFAGMTIVGLSDDPVNANNLHILFVPMFTLYGFAYVMMLWSRLELDITLLRYTFITLIYLVSGLPLVTSLLLSPERYRVNWPPYCPPYIAVLNSWTNEKEVIASDMPWAVAWYADRKSLQIPVSMSDFLSLYDSNDFGVNLIGLYLTPITGDKALVSGIYKGEDSDWAPLVFRVMHLKGFPFGAATAMPIHDECVFYCESDRWSQKPD